MPYTKKTNRTKHTIITAFIHCLEKKNFNDITVDEIANHSQISRSSFYRYFEDKYALLSHIEDDIIEHIESYATKRQQKHHPDKLIDASQTTSLLASLEEHKPAINVLLGKNGDPYFEVKLRKQISNHFFNSHFVKVHDNPKNHLIKEYQASIMIDTFKYWSKKERELSVDELVEILQSIYRHGIFHAISPGES